MRCRHALLESEQRFCATADVSCAACSQRAATPPCLRAAFRGATGSMQRGRSAVPPVSAGCFHSGAQPVLRAFLALVEAELRRIQAGASALARKACCRHAVAHSRSEEAVIATCKRREHRLHQLPADAADAVCKALVRFRTDVLFGASGALQCSLARARVRFGAKCGCGSCGIIRCGLRGPLRASARHHLASPATQVPTVYFSTLTIPFHPASRPSQAPGRLVAPRARASTSRVRRRGAASGFRGAPFWRGNAQRSPDADAARQLDARAGRAACGGRCSPSSRCVARRGTPRSSVEAATTSQPSRWLLRSAARALATADAVPARPLACAPCRALQ